MKKVRYLLKKLFVMLLTINEIIERFRTSGACIKFSPRTITHMANVIGYRIKRVGGKVGYDQSLITAISRRIREAMEYEEGLKVKTSQKQNKQPNLGDYYTYNGERDNKDYEWEQNESIISRIVTEEINKFLKEGTL